MRGTYVVWAAMRNRDVGRETSTSLLANAMTPDLRSFNPVMMNAASATTGCRRRSVISPPFRRPFSPGRNPTIARAPGSAARRVSQPLEPAVAPNGMEL